MNVILFYFYGPISSFSRICLSHSHTHTQELAARVMLSCFAPPPCCLFVCVFTLKIFYAYIAHYVRAARSTKNERKEEQHERKKKKKKRKNTVTDPLKWQTKLKIVPMTEREADEYKNKKKKMMMKSEINTKPLGTSYKR